VNKMKKLFIIMLVLLLPFWVGAYTETHYVCSNGNGAGATDGSSWANCFDGFTDITWDTDVADDGNLGPDDVLYLRDDDGDYKEQLSIGSAGLSTQPITIMNDTGETPIINGSDTMATWIDSEQGSGSTWKKTGVTTEPKQMFSDGARLTKGNAKATLNDHEWIWDTNELFYRDDSGDPDGLGIVFEASQRDQGILGGGYDYLVINGLTVKNSNNKGIAIGGCLYSQILNSTIEYSYKDGIRTNTVTDGLIQGNTVRYNGATGISFMGDTGTGLSIRQNTIHANSQLSVDSEHSWTGGIRGGGSTGSNGTIIEQNTVYDQAQGNTGSGNGIWIDTTVDGQSVTIRHNLVYDNYRHGIFLEQTNDAVVYGNISYGHTLNTIGAGFIMAANTNGIHENLMYNNTSYGNYFGYYIQGNWAAATCVDNILKNNIAVGNSQRELRALGGCENDGTNGSGNIYIYNNFGAAATDFIGYAAATPDTYADWDTVYGSDTYSIEGDPLLTDPGSGDLTLQYGSPAYDAGVNLGATYDDCLHPSSSWPSSVATIDQDLYPRWEIGAYCILKQKGPGVGLMQ
jgi:hypothetical protein